MARGCWAFSCCWLWQHMFLSHCWACNSLELPLACPGCAGTAGWQAFRQIFALFYPFCSWRPQEWKTIYIIFVDSVLPVVDWRRREISEWLMQNLSRAIATIMEVGVATRLAAHRPRDRTRCVEFNTREVPAPGTEIESWESDGGPLQMRMGCGLWEGNRNCLNFFRFWFCVDDARTRAANKSCT